MSKELEALEKIKQEFNCDSAYYGLGVDFEILESALKRLESIDNANPSEALECLNNIEADLIGLSKHITEYDEGFDNYLEDIEDNIDKVEQALLKAQEPKKYLKWEDLEFDYNMKNVKVKMGDNEYIIRYFLNALDDYDCFLCDDEANQLIRLYKQLFNDLHLERVEE